MPRSPANAALVLATVLCASCANGPKVHVPSPDAAAARSTPPVANTSLVAMVDGQPVDFAAIRSALVEVSGNTVLLDQVVDTRLAARLRSAGVVIDAGAIERERTALLDALAGEPERAADLLESIRRRQGLGPTRFDSLLRRNAGLRALVAREVRIDDAGIAMIHDTIHGNKRIARVAVLSSLADAERFARDLQATPFIDLAVARSLDESASRGGLLAPMSRQDPSFPEPLRAAVFATAVGATSAPILDGARFMVVAVVSEQPGDGVSTEASRAECERILRRSRERLLMDALARELASMDGVTVFDRAFDRASDASSN